MHGVVRLPSPIVSDSNRSVSFPIAIISDSNRSVSFTIAVVSDSNPSVSFTVAVVSDSNQSVSFTVAVVYNSDPSVSFTVAVVYNSNPSVSLWTAIESGQFGLEPPTGDECRARASLPTHMTAGDCANATKEAEATATDPPTAVSVPCPASNRKDTTLLDP
jgi:hypothetical protein